jgi:hypothetical protein
MPRHSQAQALCIAALASVTAWAAPPPPAAHCLQARLTALDFEDAGGRRTVDYCRVAEAALPPAARSILTQVRGLNAAASAVFEMSAGKLLATPFALRIKRSIRGPLISFARNESSEHQGSVTRLTLGVYTDWAGEKNEPINAGVYTHELGHVIGLLPENPALPLLYRELVNTKLMLEMMADFTAFSAVGHVFSPEQGVPACLQQAFRKITPELSYATSIDDFAPDSYWRQTDNCCLMLEKTDAHTARSRAYCADHLKDGLLPPAKPSARHFSAAYYKKHVREIDGHFVGLPLNSFLLDLSRQTSLNLAPLLLRALTNTEQDSARAFLCEIPRLKRFLQPLKETRHSVAQVLVRLEDELPASARPVFQKLWQSHGMDIGAQISEIDAGLQAQSLAYGEGADAFNLLYSDPSGKRPDPRLKKTGCWEDYPADVATPSEPGRLDDERPGCDWVCKLAPG